MTTINLILEVKKMPTAEQWTQIVKSAKYFNKNQIAHIWDIEDIQERGKQIGIKVSVKKARLILQEVDRHKDANYGISWETFDYYIENHCK